MRKRIEPTLVERCIESVAGFKLVYEKLQQQVVLRGQSQSTLENYIRRIAQMYLSQDVGTLPCAQVDEGLLERDTYVEGSLTDPPDFTPYDKLLEQNDGP